MHFIYSYIKNVSVWDPTAHFKHFEVRICILEGTEDDSVRIETCQWRTQEFCSGGGSTNSVEDRGQRERGSGSGSLLVRGSGGSCNLVQEISFQIVKFS